MSGVDEAPAWPVPSNVAVTAHGDPLSILLGVVAAGTEIALLVQAPQLGIAIAKCAAVVAVVSLFLGVKARRPRRIAIGALVGFALVALAVALLVALLRSMFSGVDLNLWQIG
jgi:hypothetical protein